jgi:uncharacterized membrane protein
MDVTVVIVLLHVLSAGWFVSGLVGRAVTWRYAREATVASTTVALLRASEYFDRMMVIPGSMVILVLGLLAAWQGGWPVLGFIAGSDSNWLLVSLILYLSLVPFVPLYLVPRRKIRNALIARAGAEDQLSPELTAALNDAGVLAYRRAELVVVIAVAGLMVTKPF